MYVNAILFIIAMVYHRIQEMVSYQELVSFCI